VINPRARGIAKIQLKRTKKSLNAKLSHGATEGGRKINKQAVPTTIAFATRTRLNIFNSISIGG
jgi:hypothetical protein